MRRLGICSVRPGRTLRIPITLGAIVLRSNSYARFDATQRLKNYFASRLLLTLLFLRFGLSSGCGSGNASASDGKKETSPATDGRITETLGGSVGLIMCFGKRTGHSANQLPVAAKAGSASRTNGRNRYEESNHASCKRLPA